MNKTMREFIPGKSLFKCTDDIALSNRHDSKAIVVGKECILRLSLLNDFRQDDRWVLMRDDQSGTLVDIYIEDLRDMFVPI